MKHLVYRIPTGLFSIGCSFFFQYFAPNGSVLVEPAPIYRGIKLW